VARGEAPVAAEQLGDDFELAADGEVRCKVCNVTVPAKNRSRHCQGATHLANLARVARGEAPVAPGTAAQQKQKLAKGDMFHVSNKLEPRGIFSHLGLTFQVEGSISAPTAESFWDSVSKNVDTVFPHSSVFGRLMSTRSGTKILLLPPPSCTVGIECEVPGTASESGLDGLLEVTFWPSLWSTRANASRINVASVVVKCAAYHLQVLAYDVKFFIWLCQSKPAGCFPATVDGVLPGNIVHEHNHTRPVPHDVSCRCGKNLPSLAEFAAKAHPKLAVLTWAFVNNVLHYPSFSVVELSDGPNSTNTLIKKFACDEETGATTPSVNSRRYFLLSEQESGELGWAKPVVPKHPKQ
jgi:hypothetical protein